MGRRLAAILAADVVGYSRLMSEDEAGTLERLTSLRSRLVEPRITERKGRIVKLMGDGVLAEFPSVVEAVRCAASIQEDIAGSERDLPDSQRIRLRIGINLGDIIYDGSDIYGDGVNIAARLEGLAEPGGICISGPAFDAVDGKLDYRFEDLGAQPLKNIAKPVRVYRLSTCGGTRSGSSRATKPLELPDKPSIAVLPFSNMSGVAEQDYFSDGITEDIITELSRFRTLFVIARNSSFAFKERAMNARDIARDLGVRYIVEGSVRRSGGRVRVTVQLIEAESSSQLWAERYDRDLEDIFAVQDEITQAIVSALPGRLDADAIERSRKRPTENLSAYDYLLRGEWCVRRGGWDDAEALALFETASRIDPDSARAHARIATWHAYSTISHDNSALAIQVARSHAERALELDDRDAMVQAIAATVYLLLGEYALTEAHIERAMALNPNDVEVLYRRGMAAIYHGDPQAGLDWLRKAMRLDPLHPETWSEILFDAHYMARDYRGAVEVFRRWHNPPSHMYAELAAALAQLSDIEGASEAVATYHRKVPAEHNFAAFAATHKRICKFQSDRDHWLEGYRKAGLSL